MRGRWAPTVIALLVACGESSGAAPTGPSGATGPSGTRGPTGPASPVAVERLDASSECDGLVPDRVPSPIDVEWTPPPGAICAGGLSDGTGHVAVSAQTAGGATWQVFTPDGAPARSFGASPLVAMPSGWHGLAVRTVDPALGPGSVSVWQRTFSARGELLGEAAVTTRASSNLTDVHALAQDPLGGSFAAAGETDLFHNHWSSVEAQRFDADGTPRWSGGVRFGASDEHRIAFMGVGASRRGHALTLWQHSAYLDVFWHDAAGAVVSSAVRAERSAEVLGSAELRAFQLDLVPLLDAGLALRVDGVFRRTYPELSTTSAPLPAWLAARARSTYRLTRGNRGYAVFPPPGASSPDCGQSVELLAPSGRLCGRLTLPGGGACTTGQVDQGWDGTVVQQHAAASCRYRVWPGLLAP